MTQTDISSSRFLDIEKTQIRVGYGLGFLILVFATIMKDTHPEVTLYTGLSTFFVGLLFSVATLIVGHTATKYRSVVPVMANLTASLVIAGIAVMVVYAIG